jgi:hypothetical protein
MPFFGSEWIAEFRFPGFVVLRNTFYVPRLRFFSLRIISNILLACLPVFPCHVWFTCHLLFIYIAHTLFSVADISGSFTIPDHGAWKDIWNFGLK